MVAAYETATSSLQVHLEFFGEPSNQSRTKDVLDAISVSTKTDGGQTGLQCTRMHHNMKYSACCLAAGAQDEFVFVYM